MAAPKPAVPVVSPPPAPPRTSPAAAIAKLVVIAQDGSPGREYGIHADQTDIGREAGDIQLPNDPYVSPRHARLVKKNGQFHVVDLNATNGVFVRLKDVEDLADGDLVLLGLEVLRFEVVKGAEKGLGPAMDQGTRVFGSPETTRNARLCQRTVEGVTRDIYHLVRDETVIGRESGDIVFTGDPFMSRRHAAVFKHNTTSGYAIRDLGSSNGTFIAIRGERALGHGDHVRVGQHLFRLELSG